MCRVTVIPIDHENEKIFLSKKARGSGKGKWIGFGGKVEIGESIDDGAIREMREETGLTLATNQITRIGVLLFTFQDVTNFDSQARAEIYVYTVEKHSFNQNLLKVNDAVSYTHLTLPTILLV